MTTNTPLPHRSTFLQAVAKDIHLRFGDNLSRTAIIFPGKRAGLFFNQHLADCAGHPVWSPVFFTISELFDSLSPLSIELPLRQLCLLHSIYCHHTHSTEELDDFFHWGELMLSDFDDVDKNMVDAKNLFVNLADIKAINARFEYLTDEQKEVLTRFFGNLHNEGQQSRLKERFIELWKVMGNIYQDLHQQLYIQGMSYEGMQHRHVIEHFDSSRLTYDHYIIVGFNVLNKVERQLFHHLQESGKALFYWDYDLYYYDNPNHEAGLFIRENIAEFGSALSDTSLFDNLRNLPEITYISASTDNAQARYLHTWVSEHITQHEQDTAIVLCNEDIIQPVLHSLPAEINNVNITMGFRLTQTAIYNLVVIYLKLHTQGYDSKQACYMLDHVCAILTHPYIIQLYPESQSLHEKLRKTNRIYIPAMQLKQHEGLGILFDTPPDNYALLTLVEELINQVSILYKKSDKADDYFTQLNEEAIFRIHLMVENFKSIISNGILNIKECTLVRLLDRIMAQSSIPFHGEPIMGLQIMGVLETRNLDFRHLVILSANEGKLPKGGNDSSFIPYNLREAFGMTTIQRRNAVYAYYFYRMIQRAQHVTIIYNDGTDGLNKQEPSRLLMQLQVEFPGRLIPQSLQAKSIPGSRNLVSIAQTADTRRKLQEHFRYDHTRKHNYRLSPSALNDYLECSLRFYLKHIEELTPPEEENIDISVSTFGTIFHKSAELAYNKLTERGNTIHDFELKALIDDEPAIQDMVDKAFRSEFFHIENDEPLTYNGTQLIVRHVICNYLRQLLSMDATREKFTYIESEKRVHRTVKIKSHGISLPILLGGTIDRIDQKDGTTRIIDYKTGGKQKSIKSISELFQRDKPRDGYVFQAFYYSHLLCEEYEKIVPSLLFIRNSFNKEFEPNIIIDRHPVTDFRFYNEEFSRLLYQTIDEIFNSNLPYMAAPYKEACKYCKFTALCGRKNV
ncbi:MAG: PD-(D/E)XK nuclease family protein [Bacteroidales bacterium]|nr:PD-(D/E)XK nuclease family protein [Bacteroidales bacterium]